MSLIFGTVVAALRRLRGAFAFWKHNTPDPDWAGRSKKAKNRFKKQKIAEARAEVEKYERRHKLPNLAA